MYMYIVCIEFVANKHKVFGCASYMYVMTQSPKVVKISIVHVHSTRTCMYM